MASEENRKSQEPVISDLELDLERQRLEFEQGRFEKEFQLRDRELKLQEAGSLSRNRVAILVAIVGLMGTLLGIFIETNTTARANIELEERKLESSLVVRAFESEQIELGLEYLLLFIHLGYIEDPDDRLRKAAIQQQQSFSTAETPDSTFPGPLSTPTPTVFPGPFPTPPIVLPSAPL